MRSVVRHMGCPARGIADGSPRAVKGIQAMNSGQAIRDRQAMKGGQSINDGQAAKVVLCYEMLPVFIILYRGQWNVNTAGG